MFQMKKYFYNILVFNNFYVSYCDGAQTCGRVSPHYFNILVEKKYGSESLLMRFRTIFIKNFLYQFVIEKNTKTTKTLSFRAREASLIVSAF